MYIALDEQGNRIHIRNAVKGKNYACPICASQLLVREGTSNAKHFAHKKGECVDDWNYDMSEWHIRMQEYFPENNREVVVRKGKEIHRADVLINRTVIEFQHSPISAEEFVQRNDFFMDLGYRVAWVFDVDEKFCNGTLYFDDDDDRLMLIWKNPMRVLSFGPRPTDYNKKYSLWLTWENEDEEDGDSFYKVIWVPLDDNGCITFKRCLIRNRTIDLPGQICEDDFFLSDKQLNRKTLRAKIRELKHNHSYRIKYSGEKGKQREDYICPRYNQFGLDLFSEKGCKYCSYCYMIAEKEQDGKYKRAVYCCYPERARALFKGHPGYECDAAPFYGI